MKTSTIIFGVLIAFVEVICMYLDSIKKIKLSKTLKTTISSSICVIVIIMGFYIIGK